MKKAVHPRRSGAGIALRARAAACLALAALFPAFAAAQAGADCVGEVDPARRLACYDRLFRNVPDAPAPATAAPGAAAAPAVTASAPTTTTSAPDAQDASVASKFWELSPRDKRGTFVVRTYQPNFFLPFHASNRVNRAPSSPTRAATALNDEYRSVEAKLQVSLRAKVAEEFLLPRADLWFAYTQRSLWQLWNTQASAPFRSTDYQPEAIYVVPVPEGFTTLPFDWRWRMVQFGIAHQSNGQALPLSRSWNRAYLGTSLERGSFGLQMRVNHRFSEDATDDDNPNLTRYIGQTELTASWLPGLSAAALTWRTDFKSLRRGSLQLDWTYPVSRQKPEGLRWYLQVFSGYGETLLDYNHRQTSVGLGLALFQF